MVIEMREKNSIRLILGYLQCLLVVKFKNFHESIKKKISFIRVGEEETLKISFKFVEIVDFDDCISENKKFEYLLQFLWGEIFKISLFSIESFVMGMKSRGSRVLKFRKFRFCKSKHPKCSTLINFYPFSVFISFIDPSINPYAKIRAIINQNLYNRGRNTLQQLIEIIRYGRISEP